jgi:hypothetical protein
MIEMGGEKINMLKRELKNLNIEVLCISFDTMASYLNIKFKNSDYFEKIFSKYNLITLDIFDDKEVNTF